MDVNDLPGEAIPHGVNELQRLNRTNRKNRTNRTNRTGLGISNGVL